MAIYHCSIKVISRGKGKSAVAAAAYRAGEKITNEFDGMTHDYTHKGGVVHTEILLPDHAPAKYADRAVFNRANSPSSCWSAVRLTRAATSGREKICSTRVRKAAWLMPRTSGATLSYRPHG